MSTETDSILYSSKKQRKESIKAELSPTEVKKRDVPISKQNPTIFSLDNCSHEDLLEKKKLLQMKMIGYGVYESSNSTSLVESIVKSVNLNSSPREDQNQDDDEEEEMVETAVVSSSSSSSTMTPFQSSPRSTYSDNGSPRYGNNNGTNMHHWDYVLKEMVCNSLESTLFSSYKKTPILILFQFEYPCLVTELAS